MQALLPDKYYLTHAKEVFKFAKNVCPDLLQTQHLTYLDNFELLDQDAQCMLIRLISRKPQFLNKVSLSYPEIHDPATATQVLCEYGYVSEVRGSDWPEFLEVLTKPQLLDYLDSIGSRIRRSSKKAELLEMARLCQVPNNLSLAQPAINFLVRRQQEVIDYILFLFFGDLRNRFEKFAMRDLGVLKTKQVKTGGTGNRQNARFINIEEAQSAFQMQSLYRQQTSKKLSDNTAQIKEDVAEYLLETSAIGTAAQQTKDKLILELASEYVQNQPEMAIRLWQSSKSTVATERWIRESYKRGDREALKHKLDVIRSQQTPAETKVFVEDFYARKYQGKRTSVYTDLLREPSRTLRVDETYLNDVEEGVIQQYRRCNKLTYFTENRHWRELFALTFWDLLFDQDDAQHNEFDRLPAKLTNGYFYIKDQHAIEQRLASLCDIELTSKQFAGVATSNYGYPTGLFGWRTGMLDSLNLCLKHSPCGAIAAVLRAMAKDFKHCCDGYPDLMVLDNTELRFEEIKAPGDVLRPNQLVSINRLRQAGFSVDIAQVEWVTDPLQVYAVVDIETTGGRKGLHAITEIAVVKVLNGKVIDRWSSLINPQRPIPSHITRLTSITNQMVAGAPLFQEVADELARQLEGCIFVAHNVGFDYGFIKSAYQAINRQFKMPKFCTVVNTRKTFPGLASYSLGNLCQHFDIDLSSHHRALADATATADLLRLIQHTRSELSSQKRQPQNTGV